MAVRPTRRTKVLTETIILGSDHQGFQMKEFLKEKLLKRKFAVKDVGTYNGTEPVDYPDYVAKVAHGVSSGMFRRGIAVDGTGVGASVVANRFPHVRAALCNDIGVARLSRAHADSNILVLAGRLTPDWLAEQILDAWLTTAFEGGRHQRRISQIDNNTRLSIAMTHLDQIDIEKVDAGAVNEPFFKRVVKDLDRLIHRITDERRSDEQWRSVQSCPTKITCNGKTSAGFMTDLSAKGAQFKLGQASQAQLMVDDEISCEIRTPYGRTEVKGVVRWVDTHSGTIGVAFADEPRDARDPLKLLQDSL